MFTLFHNELIRIYVDVYVFLCKKRTLFLKLLCLDPTLVLSCMITSIEGSLYRNTHYYSNIDFLYMHIP